MTDPAAGEEATSRELGYESATALSAEQRQTTRLCLSALGVFGIGSMIGVAFSLYLVNHFPLLLVALSPLGRHIVLAVPLANPVALVSVGVGRRLLFYLASFHLGRALGPAGIPWLEARAARFGRFVRWVEGLFWRAPRLVVLLMTGPTVSALAGVSGMRTAVYLPLATVSLVARVAVMVFFGEVLREYIEVILAWINEYWLPGTLVMVVAVGIYRWRRQVPVSAIED
jgi:hypothetical protein